MLLNFALLTAITENGYQIHKLKTVLRKYHLTLRHLMATFDLHLSICDTRFLMFVITHGNVHVFEAKRDKNILYHVICLG